jgi:hypothetical protein
MRAMSKKKETTPAYGDHNSYPLTMEQVQAALGVFQWELMEETIDEKAGALLAVLRCFTYTTDDSTRENMLVAAEAALLPFIGAVHKAVDALAIKTHRQLIRASGEQ